MLPGADDADTLFQGLARGPATGFALQLAALDHDGLLVAGSDGTGRLHDHDGWLF